MNKKIAAVIVTFNRIELLKLCLAALDKQTHLVDSIIVINNNSKDGTKEFLDKWRNDRCTSLAKPIVMHLPLNTGGAGGFNRGMKAAIESGHDWVWMMDDDVVPDKDALQALVDAARKTSGNAGFYSSMALDASRQHTVNVPQPDSSPSSSSYPNWGIYLADGLIKVETSTFVSIFIPKDAVIEAGLPIKEFFIWGDDTEYTLRLNRQGFSGYWVGHSRVLHLRPGIQGLDIRKEQDPQRISMYKNLYRNTVFLKRRYGLDPILFTQNSLIRAIGCLIKFGSIRKFMIIIHGVLSGWFFNPKIEFPSLSQEAPPTQPI